jgi:hypothetical protein
MLVGKYNRGLKTIVNLMKEFLTVDMYQKRSMISTFLIHNHVYYSLFLFELLNTYDEKTEFTSSEHNFDQNVLLESFPYWMQEILENVIVNSSNDVKQFMEYSDSKIPYETQILLLNTDELVKQKAFAKLKEIVTHLLNIVQKFRMNLSKIIFLSK